MGVTDGQKEKHGSFYNMVSPNSNCLYMYRYPFPNREASDIPKIIPK